MAKLKRICSVDGCGKVHEAKGWCHAHYLRWWKHGDPLGGATAPGEALVFLENTVLSFEGENCLIWPFSKNGNGYGRVWHNGKVRLVSRIVCEAEHGPPPTPRHEAAHSCGKGNLGCVNRKHLEWKTREENQADRLVHGTHNRGERHNMAKLTEDQVLEIRASAKLQRELAKEYGISLCSVSQIRTRKTWAWLESV